MNVPQAGNPLPKRAAQPPGWERAAVRAPAAFGRARSLPGGSRSAASIVGRAARQLTRRRKGAAAPAHAQERGRCESRPLRAEPQWIVATRPLCHLQYPAAHPSRLQGIRPPGAWKCRCGCTLLGRAAGAGLLAAGGGGRHRGAPSSAASGLEAFSH